MGLGCSGGVFDIFSYDGQAIRPITTDAISQDVANQGTTINDHDEIAWTRYNFCVSPWKSTIMRYSAGQTIPLSGPNEVQPQAAFVNNVGQVAWTSRLLPAGTAGIYLWEAGETTLLTDWGGSPMLSDTRDVGVSRWHTGSSTAQAWLFRSATWYQLTDDPFNNYVHDMSARSELTIVTGTFPEQDIAYLRRLRLGDLNCDGRFDGSDIDPFFLALADPVAYTVQFPNCNTRNGDMNGDGSLNGADIDPFFACLGGGVCP